MSPFDRAHTTSYSTLIETMRLSCTVFEIRRVICRNSPTLPYPMHLHLAPPLGVTPFEFRKDFWHQKTRVPWLSCGVVCVFLCLAILVEHRLVTDRQTDTDRRTHDHGIYRESKARAVKIGLHQRKLSRKITGVVFSLKHGVCRHMYAHVYMCVCNVTWSGRGRVKCADWTWLSSSDVDASRGR